MESFILRSPFAYKPNVSETYSGKLVMAGRGGSVEDCIVTEFFWIRCIEVWKVRVCVEEEMVFRTGGCQRQNGDDDKCISTGSMVVARWKG